MRIATTMFSALAIPAAIALALSTTAAAAATPGQSSTTQTPAPATSAQFYPGTVSTATYPLPGNQRGTLTVRAGMPAHVAQYGPPPAFKALDTNHDGRIDEKEAKAYPPLDSGFLYASGGRKTITRAQYERWAKSPR